MADFLVVAESVWHSGEGKVYRKGQIISLPASTKTKPESSVQPVAKTKPGKNRAED